VNVIAKHADKQLTDRCRRVIEQRKVEANSREATW
jgi:hypothetical protein